MSSVPSEKKEQVCASQQSVARQQTRINKLVMDGFKSFGKRTELLFGPGFNVVIGANGSGKSNVLDALCFVLGKSSSKSLRAEKSANLIYNGGKTKNPAKTAEVSIFFDNSSRVFPLPDDEVKITRIVRQDGLSKYKINGKTKTRQEIIELLSAAKINPDGYNIILQGDIMRLVEMSPIERRQLVEEIAGIGIYEEKKQQALNELQRVDEKLNEAEIILKEREGYLKDLKKDRDQALKYKRLSDNIRKNKASYLKRQIDRKDSEKKGLEEKSAKHRKKLEKLNAEIQSLRDEVKKRKDEIARISLEIEQNTEVGQQKIQKEIEQLRVDIATAKTRMSSCSSEIAKIQHRREQLKLVLEEMEQKLKGIDSERNALAERKAMLEKETAAIEKKIREFRQRHKLDDSEGVEQKIEQLDKTIEEKQKQLQQLLESQQNLLREKDKIEFHLQTIDQNIAKVVELEKEHKSEMELLKKKKEQFRKLVFELNELLNSDSKHAVELAEKRKELFAKKEELAKLEIKNAGIQESIAENTAVKKILENKHLLGGVYGTVAELGQAEQKYSLALEIAASQKIHSIVVDDDKTAANCIRFLKENKLGIATFLPLNKIKPVPKRADVDELAKGKGVHGFAIDLISFEPKFKDVFSYVFGNTLVVESIETARKIGIGKVKMVSLDGDLAELSGAMSGGYRHKKAGSFKEKSLVENIEKLKEEVAGLEAEISEIEAARKENEEKIARLRELKANLEGEIIKSEKSLHLDSGDLDASKAYKEELKKQLAENEKKVQEVVEKISCATDELAKLKTEKQCLRNRISELRNPALLAELNAFEQKRRELMEELVRAESELRNLEMQSRDVFGAEKEKNQKLIAETINDERSFTEEIKQLSAKCKEQELLLKQKESEQQRFYKQFKSLFEARNRASDEINEFEGKILGIEDNARKEELQLNLISIEEARVKAELAGLEAEFGQYEGVELDMEKPEETLRKEIAEFEKMMADIGSVNLKALEIYETIEKEYSVLVEKKNQLIAEKNDVIAMMNEIESKKTELFMNTLKVVDENFKKFFRVLSTKGDAYLELENKEKPFEDGLCIKVKLTTAKFLDIRSLSGGEKTLTALAFLFAIQEHEPASFYVLDEVDSALDKTNSQLLAKLIRDYCTKAQYIVISHNDSIILEADTIYGVSINPEVGISSVVSMKG